jgi:hypothetical protein
MRFEPTAGSVGVGVIAAYSSSHPTGTGEEGRDSGRGSPSAPSAPSAIAPGVCAAEALDGSFGASTLARRASTLARRALRSVCSASSAARAASSAFASAALSSASAARSASDLAPPKATPYPSVLQNGHFGGRRSRLPARSYSSGALDGARTRR